MPRILVQAGHNPPMQPGHETETGTGGEREFAAKMQVALAALFRKDGRFHVDTCPGLMPSPGWAGDVFIALHCDGAGPTAHGFGFGWPGNGRDPGRGPELARRIGGKFAQIPHPGGHRADNYTDGERGYYGWGHVSAPTKVLIEHGFMTNPSERAWLVSHIPQMAAATYNAVLEHLGLKSPAYKPVTYKQPWGVFAGGQQIGAGSLVTKELVQRISGALEAAGKVAPWTATLEDGTSVARGRFWPPGLFTLKCARQLTAGKNIVIDKTVTIKTRRV